METGKIILHTGLFKYSLKIPFIVCYPSCKKEGGIRKQTNKQTCICSFLPKKYKKNKPGDWLPVGGRQEQGRNNGGMGAGLVGTRGTNTSEFIFLYSLESW